MLLSTVPIPCVSHYVTCFLPPFSFGDKFDICFQGSICVCSLPLTFEGRARRTEYWMFALFNTIFLIAATILDNLLKTNISGTYYGVFYFVYALAVFLPSI